MLAEGLSSASRLMRGPLDQILATPGTAQAGPSDQSVAEIAVLINGTVARSRPYVFPPVITLETAAPAEPGTARSRRARRQFRQHGLPSHAAGDRGLLPVQSGGSDDARSADRSAAQDLARQLAGPLSAGRVLAGKALSTAVLSFLMLLILTAVGASVAPSGVSLAGYLLLSFALVAAATGFASAVFGFARGERQGTTLASIVALSWPSRAAASSPSTACPRRCGRCLLTP